MTSSWGGGFPKMLIGEGGGRVLGVTSSQTNGVRATGGVVDGGAGGLGHRPLVPHLLAVVAAPESHGDIIIVGQRDGLLEWEEDGEPGEHTR